MFKAYLSYNTYQDISDITTQGVDFLWVNPKSRLVNEKKDLEGVT